LCPFMGALLRKYLQLSKKGREIWRSHFMFFFVCLWCTQRLYPKDEDLICPPFPQTKALFYISLLGHNLNQWMSDNRIVSLSKYSLCKSS
jgi:hypothetical protein